MSTITRDMDPPATAANEALGSRAAKVVHLTTVHVWHDTRVFVKQCRSLARAGHEVILIAPETPEGGLPEELVKFRALPRTEFRPKRMTHTAAQAFRAALREDADVYHLHDFELLPVGLALRLAGRRVVYDAHEDLGRMLLAKPWLPRILRPLVARVCDGAEKGISRSFNAVVAATPTIKERFEEAGVNATVVCNFPIVHEFEGEGLPFAERPRSVCYVGVISDARGFETWVHGAVNNDCKLLLAGPLYPKDVLSYVSDPNGIEAIEYQGVLDRSGVAEVLKTSRAGIVLLPGSPAYRESLPVKMFEYMAAGLPVVASDFPIWREIVEGNDCGICVDHRDQSAIDEAIRMLVDNPARAEEMGRNGRRAVMEKFTWNNAFSHLEKVYDSVLGAV